MRMMHVDADLPKDTSPADFSAAKAALLARLRAHRLPPSIIINSGNGYGVFWLLKIRIATDRDPIKIADLKARNKQLAIGIGGGADHCENLDRVMRVPGLVNFPNAAKRKRGRVMVPTELVEFHPERVYDVDQFPPAPAEAPKSKVPKKSKANPGTIDEVPSDSATVDMSRLEADSEVLRFIKSGPVRAPIAATPSTMSAVSCAAGAGQMRTSCLWCSTRTTVSVIISMTRLDDHQRIRRAAS